MGGGGASGCVMWSLWLPDSGRVHVVVSFVLSSSGPQFLLEWHGNPKSLGVTLSGHQETPHPKASHEHEPWEGCRVPRISLWGWSPEPCLCGGGEGGSGAHGRGCGQGAPLAVTAAVRAQCSAALQPPPQLLLRGPPGKPWLLWPCGSSPRRGIQLPRVPWRVMQT